jgi:hypothetical protein
MEQAVRQERQQGMDGGGLRGGGSGCGRDSGTQRMLAISEPVGNTHQLWQQVCQQAVAWPAGELNGKPASTKRARRLTLTGDVRPGIHLSGQHVRQLCQAPWLPNSVSTQQYQRRRRRWRAARFACWAAGSSAARRDRLADGRGSCNTADCRIPGHRECAREHKADVRRQELPGSCQLATKRKHGGFIASCAVRSHDRQVLPPVSCAAATAAAATTRCGPRAEHSWQPATACLLLRL